MPELHQIREQGLTSALAKDLQRKFGRNVLPSHRVSVVHLIVKQFTSAIVLLMVAAAIISWAIQDTSGAVIIGIIIAVNASIGFTQEYRAERKLVDIELLVQPTAIVKRDGVFQTILRQDVVVGDLVQLTAGTIVPADMDLVFAEGLFVDESSISGESLPVEKSLETDRKVEMGTVVTYGMGEGTVSAIGSHAQLGQIVELAQRGRPTNFEVEIARLTELCMGIVAVTAVLLFLLKLLIHPAQALSVDFIVFILAIGIGILPETLPLVATVALSNGALALSRLGVVVRTLSAIQDLGAITVLCSDKTGTLTENTLTVADTLIEDQGKFTELLAIAARIHDLVSDPFQDALSLHAKPGADEVKLLHTLPFDASSRSASFIVSIANREVTVTQGAYEVVCKGINMSPEQDLRMQEWITQQESQGRRILAFSVAQGLKRTLAALISFVDPIRSTALSAIERAKMLGIAVKVISGDSERVTSAVCRQLNLTNYGTGVISGYDWEKYTQEQKRVAVETITAFARFLPAQKYEVIRLLRDSGEVVGYVGDGVNDAPSLKLADVGICVANGTDIAKDASDVILLKRGLNVIVSGIEHGRAIFENISKYLRETLTENLGNFLSISGLSLFITYLPMLPIQILVTNLITDFPHLAIATDRVDGESVRTPRKLRFLTLIRFMVFLSFLSSAADMAYFSLFRTQDISTIQTGWFVFSTFAEIASIFSTRSRRFFFQGAAPSPMLIAMSVGVVAFTLLALFVAPLSQFLKLAPLSLSQVGIIVLVSVAYMLTFDFVKVRIYRRWPESY